MNKKIQKGWNKTLSIGLIIGGVILVEGCTLITIIPSPAKISTITPLPHYNNFNNIKNMLILPFTTLESNSEVTTYLKIANDLREKLLEMLNKKTNLNILDFNSNSIKKILRKDNSYFLETNFEFLREIKIKVNVDAIMGGEVYRSNIKRYGEDSKITGYTTIYNIYIREIDSMEIIWEGTFSFEYDEGMDTFALIGKVGDRWEIFYIGLSEPSRKEISEKLVDELIKEVPSWKK